MAPHSDCQDQTSSFSATVGRRGIGCDRIETLDPVLKALAHRQGIPPPATAKQELRR